MDYVSVIVTFNRKKLLTEAVESLLKQQVRPKKIVVIDNHSNDGTGEYLRDKGLMDNPVIHFARLDDNLGGAGGFKAGIKEAMKFNPEWISLSDDDAVFHDDYFAAISDSMSQYPNVQAFSGTVKLEDGRTQTDQRSRVVNWNRLKAVPIPQEDYQTNTEIDVFTFCGCLINAKLIRKIGLPDADFFIWSDDIEYSMRIRKYSKIMNIASAVLTHKTSVPSLDLANKYKPDWREYYGIRNRLITVHRHSHSSRTVPLYFVYTTIKAFLSIFSSRYKGFRKHVFSVYKDAYFDGIFGREGKNSKYLPGK